MPELPEVETVRRFLESHIKNKNIIGIELLHPDSFIGDPDLIRHASVSDFSRTGKQLTIFLNNKLALLFHLKMTGQLVFVPQVGDSDVSVLGHPTKNSSSVPNNSTRVIFTFSDHSKLYFNDQRKFGWIRVLDPTDIPQFQKNLGPDILSPDFTLEYFKKQLSRSSRPVKVVLLDQSYFAGIGNIYACDSLWEARIHPLTPANSVPTQKIPVLYQAVIDIIQESIAHGGSTAKDNKYILPDGSVGGHQFHFRVYQKEGEPCPRDGHLIEYQKVAGRGTFFCPVCQK